MLYQLMPTTMSVTTKGLNFGPCLSLGTMGNFRPKLSFGLKLNYESELILCRIIIMWVGEILILSLILA